MATETDIAPVHVHARATVRPDKADAVAELTEHFRSAAAAVLTEYRGLTVKQISDLRVALGSDTTYSVVKNTLTKLAAGNAGLAHLEPLLEGPIAVAFVNGEPVTAAKALRDYARTNPALVIKGGVLDGKPLTVEEIRKLADLESREVLLTKMAGALKGSLSQAVYLLAAPLAQAARAVGALQAKAEADPSVLAAGAGTPAAEVEQAAAVEQDVPSAVPPPGDESAPAGVIAHDSTGTDSTATESTSTDSTSTDSTPA